jgi:His-Xaa-Ser system radical SAM maturase HxsC
MKQLQGKCHNLGNEILGKITLKGKNIFNRKDYILVSENASDNKMGYLATITSRQVDCAKGCIVSDVVGVESFNEGDIVLINKSGEIIFLYEIKSLHNAIFATERCNHRCIMCPQPPVLEEEDKTPLNLKLISLLDKKTIEIGITGGEPTLIGDKLFDIIGSIKKHVPNAGISLLSNGVKFADKMYAFKLAKCCCKDLQVDIPIFSDIASEHNRIVGAKTFYKTIQGIYNLALFRTRIGLRIVIHRQTYKRLPQLADYIYHNFPFVSQVAFIQMETTGCAFNNIDDLWIDPYDYNEQLREAVLLLDNRGMKPLIYNAQLCVLPEDIRRFATNSISDWKDTYLPICDECVLKGKCGGLFASNQILHSKYITPFKADEQTFDK